MRASLDTEDDQGQRGKESGGHNALKESRGHNPLCKDMLQPVKHPVKQPVKQPVKSKTTAARANAQGESVNLLVVTLASEGHWMRGAQGKKVCE